MKFPQGFIKKISPYLKYNCTSEEITEAKESMKKYKEKLNEFDKFVAKDMLQVKSEIKKSEMRIL